MKVLMLLFLVSCLMVPCFAGAVVNEGFYRPHEVIEDAPMPTPPKPRSVSIDEISKAVAKKLGAIKKGRVKPSKGFAIGIHSGFPTLIYSTKIWDVELGYTSINSDQKVLVKAAIGLAGDHDDYTVVKAGVALVEDNGTKLGLFLGCEQYIENSVSITGDIYLTNSDTVTTNFLTGVIGGRLYF